MKNFSLLSSVRTKSDLNAAREEIEVIRQAIYKKNYRDFLKKSVRVSTYDYLSSVKFDLVKIKSLIEDAEKNLDKFKILTLTIAFDPTESFAEKVNFWVKENLGEAVAIDFKKNQGITGGAEVVFEGIYRNYTLGKILEEGLDKEKGAIIGKLKAN